MWNRIAASVICAAVLVIPVLAQSAQLPAPSPVEKVLAARASDVTEVTLDKNMLAFAAKFMTGKNGDDAGLQHLIEGLDGIYVRTYEFNKEGEFSAEQVDQLRKYFETSTWSSLVKERDIKTGESSDVMVKLVNGKSEGLFILDVEPKEISIVMILGSIRMENLGKLGGLAGLGSLQQQAPKASKSPKAEHGPKGELEPQEELGPKGDIGSQNAQVAQGAPLPPPPPPTVAQAQQDGAQSMQGPQDSQGGVQNQHTPLPRCKGKRPCIP
jgi:hypothetical protein